MPEFLNAHELPMIESQQQAQLESYYRKEKTMTTKHNPSVYEQAEVAKVCHEVNRAYCAAIGDNSQPSWEDAPEWQRQSAMNGVVYHALHPDSKPEDSHNSWLREKAEAGWKWGPVKDPAAKEHPCFVPYDQLPENQKVKDYLFIAVVRAMLPF